MKKRYMVGILIIGFGIVFWLLIRDALAPAPVPTGPGTTLQPEVQPAQKDDLIIVTTPLPQAKVTSPLIVKGKARGTWYFEASFPITLLDAAGNVLVQTHAEAQGEWMTTDYVPFTVSIPYTLPAGTTNGFLVLHKDNPSGEPQFDNSLSIPITFQ